MPIPRDDPLERPERPGEQFPARGIRPEKVLEGSLLTLSDITPGSIGAAPTNHGHLLHNLSATSDPTVDDDEILGYTTASIWIVTVTPKKIFVCVTAAEGAADWNQTDVSKAVVAKDDVSSPPTDAELDTAFGDPATLGAGFTGLLDDNNAGTAVWLCYVVAGAWWYEALTKAV